MPPHFGLCNLGDILRLPTHGDRAAVIEPADSGTRSTLSAAEFDRLCMAVGRGLARRGVVRGARIGILAENRVEFIACYFGIMRLGAVAVPVSHKLPQRTIEHIFRDSAIDLAFCDRARRPSVAGGVPVIDFDDPTRAGFDGFLDFGPLETWIPPVAGDGRELAQGLDLADGAHDLAEILYTSGSTGMPKGVPLGHRGQLWAIAHYLGALPADEPKDSTIIVAPLYHMNGLFNITVALAQRVAVVLMPRFDARRYLETVARHRCTILSGIPTMFALMVRERDLRANLDLGSVRDISIGSAPLTDALLAQVHTLFPNAQIRNGYGTTEAGPAVFGPHPDGLPRPALSLGHPFADVQCALLDGPSAGEGVLALRTPALTSGYLNQPQATAARMRDGWYVTGDVMQRDAQGFYFFVGRADDMFVCGGENIYPGEVEKLLERHADVAQAVVVPAPDDIKGQIPVAFIVPRPGAAPSAETIKAYALSEGPAFAHPRFVEFMPSLPVSGTHKIDRSALTAAAVRLVRAAGRSGAPATTPLP